MTQMESQTAPHEAPLDAATVPAAFQRLVALHPERLALRSLDGSVMLTWREVDARVRQIAAGFAAHGLGHGDSLAIVLPNTVDCHVIDFAAVHLGAVPFSIFNSSPPNQIEHQLENSDAAFVVTTSDLLPKVREAASALGDQVRLIVVTDGESADGTLTLEEVVASGDPHFDLDARWRAVTADDLATLIYTSGTTGPPKGAQWSHRTAMAEQRAMDAALPLPTENLISFLPMAHAGGKATCHYMALGYGPTITACPDMRDVPRALATVHPDAFFSVPRLWEKLQVAIEGMIQAEPDTGKRERLQSAVQMGLAYVRAAESGSGADPSDLADLQRRHEDAKAEFRPILERLGLDRMKAAYIGGAPSPGEISQFFRAVGVPMLEAYGLTEGSLNVFNRVEDFKSGTAGKPLPGVELVLADDGEILVRSDLNFVGYRKQPDETADVLDADGWLHTGDIATLDDAGFVRIVDRKKEIIINAAGKNMSPVNIESAVRAESSLIAQVVAIGDRRRYVTALITLDPEALVTFSSRAGLADPSVATVSEASAIRAEVSAAIDRANKRLHGNEQIKKFLVLPEAWQADSDELTPTAKLKRRVIHAKYADEIESLYTD